MIDADTINSIICEWFADCSNNTEVTKTYYMIVSECDRQMEFMHKEFSKDGDGDA